jgi:hypothetical protein
VRVEEIGGALRSQRDYDRDEQDDKAINCARPEPGEIALGGDE